MRTDQVQGDSRLRRRLVVSTSSCKDHKQIRPLVHVWSADTGLSDGRHLRRLVISEVKLAAQGMSQSVGLTHFYRSAAEEYRFPALVAVARDSKNRNKRNRAKRR
jgi:hypothetical protein